MMNLKLSYEQLIDLAATKLAGIQHGWSDNDRPCLVLFILYGKGVEPGTNLEV